MKFIVAVVILALAVFANAGVVPLGWGGAIVAAPLSYTAHEAPWAHAAPIAYASPWAITDAHAHIAHAPIVHAAHAAPIVHAAHIAAPIVHAAPVVVAHEGQYVAANRGSVHTAPLPGHTQSAASINLEPAPGTW